MKHPAQESDRIPGRTVAGVGVGVIISTILGLVVAAGIQRCRIHELRVSSAPPPPIEGDINMIETRPFTVEAQGLEQHAREETELGSYGWLDRERGVVHIPIEAAFELYLQKRGRR